MNTDKSDKERKKRQGMNVKVYLVFLRHNVANSSQAHDRVIGARLTYSAAEKLKDLNPGSYIFKVFATK